MDDAGLLRASERERTLYEELGAVYRALLAVLAARAVPVDPAAVAAQQRRAEATVDALRAVGATLAPHRLAGRAVAPEVQSIWRASADLAAIALEANRQIAVLARARQDELTVRLARLDDGRRALAGYRPAADPERGAAQRA